MNVEIFVQNIKTLCAKRGISPTAACKESGVGTSFIPDVKRGRIPSVDKFEKIASYLGVSIAELLGETVVTNKSYERIPVLGIIPAGVPIEAVEDILDWEDIPIEWTAGGRQYFGLKVIGDSMFPEYLPGDTVIVRKQSTCDSGDDCVVMVNGDAATLKQVYMGDDGSMELRPINTAYAARTYTTADIEALPVVIAGVVVELRRKKK